MDSAEQARKRKPFQYLIAKYVLLPAYKLKLAHDLRKIGKPSVQRQLKAQADLIRQKAREWKTNWFYPVIHDALVQCKGCENHTALTVYIKLAEVEEEQVCGSCWLRLMEQLNDPEMHRFLAELKSTIQNDPSWADVDFAKMRAYVVYLKAKTLINPTGPEGQKLERIRQFVRTNRVSADFQLDDEGTAFVLTPISDAAREWVSKGEQPDADDTDSNYQLVIEKTHLEEALQRIRAEGWTVEDTVLSQA